MNSYSVEIKPPARKELEALPDRVLARVVRKLESLAQTPRPPGCKKLKGYKDQWRVRVGEWRVVYLIDDVAKLVSITRIAHRREVYE
ncbi:MAG TPA: type II toxin-antitoxin system RelE/ParE family toxin [Bryobacteraceae bacterium]|nr:type II toxin-antitoxin system RelE/ParE family toxin [Bryobacteraceae bacterium]